MLKDLKVHASEGMEVIRTIARKKTQQMKKFLKHSVVLGIISATKSYTLGDRNCRNLF